MTSLSAKHFSIGVCDYPEHVPAEDWQKHARLQQSLGLSWVRLAEFSWAKIEPAEGQYQWEWLDNAIDIYAQHGLQVVLGTPTATPPAWLITAHPEILPVDENGQVKKFGSRRHYDHASETYRVHCVRIVTAMAKRYANHTAVKGWQTDNELGHEGTTVSYGGASEARFPLWLEEKYGTLNKLNDAWGNAFWSQDYTTWQQIKAPNLTAVRQANPSHKLDYQRFCSDMIVEFQKLQIEILRSVCPEHFITHNCVIFSAECDLYKLAEGLDFVAWDSYPIGMLEFFATWESEQVKTEYARTGSPDLVSLNHDLYRGLLSQKHFWVMEQQCGHANWAQFNPLPADGAVKLWTAQAWAHGASSVIYFRFRASHFAQEIMHSGLLKQNGQPDRGYHEVEQLAISDFELGESDNRIAVVHDYESLWSYNHQPHNQDLSYWYQFVLFYSGLRKLGLTVDIVHPKQLKQRNYKLVVCPALTLLTPESARSIKEMSDSAKFIFGPRTDFRDQYGKAAEQGQFQQLKSLIKGQLLNFDSMRPTLNQTIISSKPNDVQHQGRLWCESYQADECQTLYRYQGGPLDGQAAVIESHSAITVGALSESLIESVIKQQCKSLHIPVEDVSLPDGVRVTQINNKQLLVNFNQHAISVKGQELSPVNYKLV
ncbi:beta-galactosidase [Aliiglaciecola sp.]|nr:beta-galactosidase [Aliiglaciecola sp.]